MPARGLRPVTCNGFAALRISHRSVSVYTRAAAQRHMGEQAAGQRRSGLLAAACRQCRVRLRSVRPRSAPAPILHPPRQVSTFSRRVGTTTIARSPRWDTFTIPEDRKTGHDNPGC
jgi:hypothetical protein